MTDRPDSAVELHRRPSIEWTAVAAGAALFAPGILLLSSPLVAAAAALGAVVLGIGCSRANGTVVDAGAALLFIAVLAASVTGVAVPVTLLAAAATVVAWDLGRSAIGVGRQLGRDADTRRLRWVHVISSSGIGIGAASLGYLVFRSGVGGLSVDAIVLLLVAGGLFVVALGR